MKKITILILLFYITDKIAICQNEYHGSISGFVLNAQTKQPVALANVFLKNTQIGAISDENGKFIITNIKDSIYTISITSLGYENFNTSDIKVENAANVDLGNMYLTTETFTLNEVTVSPGSYSIMETIASTGALALTEENIKNMAWAEDVTRAVSRLPGISSSDYSSRFSIRGGEANQVMISLDGMELYEPFHQRDIGGGLFSIVDIESVRGIDLMTGGFSAEFGNRLSGVFGMKTKNPKPDEWNTSVGLSLMYASVYTEGKFAKNKGSYLFSARRGMLDVTLKAIGNVEYFPKFYDGSFKVEYQLNKKHNLSYHLLHAGDKAFSNNSPEGDALELFNSNYNSTYTWLTLNSYLTSRISARTIVYFSDINHLRTGVVEKYEDTDKGNIMLNDSNDYKNTGIKQDWVWEINKGVHLKWGAELKLLSADYKYTSSIYELRVDSNEQLYYYDRNIDINLNPSGEQYTGYISTKFKITKRLIGETGLRYDQTTYTNDKNWSPRASLVYGFNKTTFLRAGWGHYYQSEFINGLLVSYGETEFYKASHAIHYVLGFEHQFIKGINLRAEMYYKDVKNLSPILTNLRDHLESYPEARNDLVKIDFNGSKSKGVELFLRYDEGKKISWWLSYALAKATDDIKNIEYNGLLITRTGEVPRLNNQTHTVYADINYKPTKSWYFNMSWQLYYGWPRTNYTYRYQTLDNGDLHFYAVHDEYNGTTYPPYHRLDLRINRAFETEKSGTITAFLHIINVYNRKNLKKYDLDARNDQGELSLDINGNYVPFGDNKYWLGILPVVGVKWDFSVK